MSADLIIASSMSIKDLLGILWWCFGRGPIQLGIDGIINRKFSKLSNFWFLGSEVDLIIECHGIYRHAYFV